MLRILSCPLEISGFPCDVSSRAATSVQLLLRYQRITLSTRLDHVILSLSLSPSEFLLDTLIDQERMSLSGLSAMIGNHHRGFDAMGVGREISYREESYGVPWQWRCSYCSVGND